MKRRACVVVASEMTVRAFLLRHLAAMQEQYDLTVVLNAPGATLARELGDGVRICAVPIQRKVSPFADLRCLVALVALMRAGRFDLVQSVTPKAGLLGMVAAWLARVPVRVHTFTGQVWATRTGVPRLVLRWLDRVVAAAATFTLADSGSQRDFLVGEGVVRDSKIAVLGQGSVSGVDATRFRPDPAARREVRLGLGIPSGDVALLFVGRLTRDKGVLDLAHGFARLAAARQDIHLVLVGPDEDGLTAEIRTTCGPHDRRLHFLDFTGTPERYMAACDVLCLPSYREGFGSVIIEAAATGLPAVASRIYGVVDAVVHEETGLLHRAGNVDDLVACLDRLVGDQRLRRSLGVTGRERAIVDFAPDVLTGDLLVLYARLLGGDRSAMRAEALATAGESAGWYRRFGKRALDLVFAACGLIVLLPLIGGIALLVRYRLGAPVLFRQTRPGRHGVPFSLVKFRSMTERCAADGRLLPDAERLTALGRLLRATSLDELPELWNVLTGDMSLVGPRPLLMDYLPLYSPQQARRHEVRPGITGLAQVNGRNRLSWPKRFELDVEYVDACSLALDFRILMRTVMAVVSRRDIHQPGCATVEFFKGDVAEHV